jgi:hypothetical protein
MTFIFFFRGGHKGWSILYHPFKFTEKPMVQALLKRLRINPIKQQNLSSNLIDPIQIDLIQLTIDEQRLLRTIHNIRSTENIEFSYNLQLNNSSKTKLQS